MPHEQPMPERAEKPLQSWKEIAAYLERDVRTARRWEAENGLPIRRHGAGKGSSVYAYPSEIEAWRAGRNASQPTAARRHFWAWALAASAVLAGATALWTLDLSGVEEVGAAGQGVLTAEICRGCDPLGEVSADGRYLSETAWAASGDIGLRDLDTGEIQVLGSKKSWSDPGGEAHFSVFSPDGSRIAYNYFPYDGEGRYELRTIAVNGSEAEKTVYSNPDLQYIFPAGWTRDDRLLVSLRGGDWSNALGLITLATGGLAVLKSVGENTTKPTLSPDDHWIAYDVATRAGRSERDIFLLALDGRTERRITQHPADDFVMGFTPDGRTLLFASNRTGTYGLWAMPLSADGQPGDPTILMRDIGIVQSIGVTADGALVYARDLGSVDLYRAEVDLATGRLLRRPELIQTAVQGSNEGPWLSPDGKQLAYFAATNPSLTGARHHVIRIHDLESGREREVAVDDAELVGRYGFVWSREGRKVLTQTRSKQGAWSLAEVDLATGALNTLIRNAERQVTPVGWTGDGTEALFISNVALDSEPPHPGGLERALYSIKDGAARPRLLSVGDISPAAAISPSNHRIVWPWKAWNEGARANTELIRIFSVGGEKLQEIELSAPDALSTRRVVWAPDEKSLLLQRDPGGEVWVLPLDGAAPFKTELAVPRMQNLAIHPDGKTVFFQAGDRDRRIFKTENFLPKTETASE